MENLELSASNSLMNESSSLLSQPGCRKRSFSTERRASVRADTFLLHNRLRTTSATSSVHNLELAPLGNCSTNHLADKQGSIVYSCFPEMDSDPIFNYLLDYRSSNPCSGLFPSQTIWRISIENFSHSESHYFPETAILVTFLYDKLGNYIRITDFSPFFEHHGRTYNPPKLIRMIKPEGQPRIKIELRLNSFFGSTKPAAASLGPNHISYNLESETFRLTTDVPPAFIVKEIFFVADRPFHLHFGLFEPLNDNLKNKCRFYFEKTVSYWKHFVSGLFLPLEWQEEVTRAAITLKLCQNEGTGAILAAMTTSIPESNDQRGRNWDYRFCWVRDSFHTVQSLNRLGQTSIMQKYLNFILNILAEFNQSGREDIQPLFGICLQTKIEEKEVEELNGYRGLKPVRIGNAAYTQIQNDTYGSIVLSVKQVFFDKRLQFEADRQLFCALERVGDLAYQKHTQPDAGIWELRDSVHVHTHSALMCWSACQSLAQISEILKLQTNEDKWRTRADEIEEFIRDNAWNEKHNTYLAIIFNKKDAKQRAELASLEKSAKEDLPLDASLLLLGSLGFCASDDPRYLGTVDMVGKVLMRNGFMFRYNLADDFGKPQNSFIVCTFWYIEALAYIGKKEEARSLFENLLDYRNHFGILSEDLDVDAAELWGNIPQAYSMVGIINSALLLSKPWSTVGL